VREDVLTRDEERERDRALGADRDRALAVPPPPLLVPLLVALPRVREDDRTSFRDLEEER